MTDPNQAPFFFQTINGVGRKFKHRSRHGCNSRQVAIIKFLEAMDINDDTCPEVKIIFNTAYNMGYKEGCKRTTQNTRKVTE